MIEMDSFDRLLVSDAFRSWIKLSKDIVIVGSGNFIELWNADTYKSVNNDNFDYQSVAKQLLSKADVQPL